MPKLARLDAPGILHHVIGRGIEGKKTFYNDTDRSDFIDRLAALVEEGAMAVYAWVLMPNHYHILCRTRKRPLSSSMRIIFGDNEFVQEVISGLDDLVKKNLRLSGQRKDIASLAKQVCRKYNISIGELCSGSRRRVVLEARGSISWIAGAEFEFSCGFHQPSTCAQRIRRAGILKFKIVVISTG